MNQISSTKAAKWGVGYIKPLIILGGIVGAAVIALGHHMFDLYLDGKQSDGYWDPAKSRSIENALAAIFKIIFTASAGVSLCQVAWYKIRRVPFPVNDLDALLGAPSLMSIFRVNLILRAPAAAAILIAILVSPVIPIVAPSLTVHLGEPSTQSITVPTLNLTTDEDIGAIQVDRLFFGRVSERWSKVALQGVISDAALGWKIPEQCSPECNYTVTYSAAALRCSDLSPSQIFSDCSSPLQVPPSACLFGYAKGVIEPGILNTTVTLYTGDRDSQYGLVLAYLPMAFNDSLSKPKQPYGSACTFYNATYTAEVSYAAGTQLNSPRILEYHEPLNVSYQRGFPLYPNRGIINRPQEPFAPGLGSHVNLLAMSDAFLDQLGGAIRWDGTRDLLSYDYPTLILKTKLFSVSDAYDWSFDLNHAEGITNLSQSLTDLFANMTLNFMNLNTGTTSVLATIPSRKTVYHYDHLSLVLTYSIAIGILASAGLLGLWCLHENGVPSTNNFSQILVTTRNPMLDSTFRGACLGSGAAHDETLGRIRLRFGEVQRYGPSEEKHAAFGLVDRQHVQGVLKKEEAYF